MDQMKTGALIRALRQRCGMTQVQLAERIGISDKAVSKWECGAHRTFPSSRHCRKPWGWIPKLSSGGIWRKMK